MSSTNRHGREREKDDFYETPGWCGKAILRRLDLPKTTTIFDPCAGRGAILRAARELGYESLCGIEIDAGRALEAVDIAGFDAVRTGDALDPNNGRYWSTAGGAPMAFVMNPPFSLAFEFVTAAIAVSQARFQTYGDAVVGRLFRPEPVAALLRLGFAASQHRESFHRQNPSDLHVLPRRPSFINDETWKLLLQSWKAEVEVWHDLTLQWKSYDAWVARGASGDLEPPALPRPGKDEPRRPSKTDSADYAWFVWNPPWGASREGGRWSPLTLLPEDSGPLRASR